MNHKQTAARDAVRAAAADLTRAHLDGPAGSIADALDRLAAAHERAADAWQHDDPERAHRHTEARSRCRDLATQVRAIAADPGLAREIYDDRESYHDRFEGTLVYAAERTLENAGWS